jgi:hypothetical protein
MKSLPLTVTICPENRGSFWLSNYAMTGQRQGLASWEDKK